MKKREHHFVTGAAGFIGSHLVDKLLADGHLVSGVDNLKLGRRGNLRAALAHEEFMFREADLLVPDQWTTWMEERSLQDPVVTVWHLAANSDIQAGVADPRVDLEATLLTTFEILRWMKRVGVRGIVFASSSAIYGSLSGLIREDSGPCHPASNYGAMKLASEGMISAAVQVFLEKALILRFPNVIGPRSTHGVIHDLVLKLLGGQDPLLVLGDGKQEKPYLHVEELVCALRYAREVSGNGLTCLHVAPADTATVKFIAESVRDEVKATAGVQFESSAQGWVGDVPKYQFDTAAMEALGWRAKLSSGAAVRRAVQEIAAELRARGLNDESL